MIIGIVDFFDSRRGFGFIRPESGDSDIFVHIKQLERSGLTTLATGQKVRFEIDQTAKTGKSDRATNITVVD